MTAHSSTKVRHQGGKFDTRNQQPFFVSRSIRFPQFLFLVLGVLCLCLGLTQSPRSHGVSCRFARHGINASTMRVAFIAAGFTTMSLVFFKIGGKPGREDAS